MSKILYYWERLKVHVYTAIRKRMFKSFGKHSFLGRNSVYMGEQYISIGDDFVLGNDSRLTAWDCYNDQCFTPEIQIGNNCSIGQQSHITAINRIVIGNNVLTGPKVLITDNAHGEFKAEQLVIAPLQRPLYSKGAVIIDDNVWIGEKASIMPGVHIGKGAIIAANSVVTHDIPGYSLAAGVPAKIIKQITIDK